MDVERMIETTLKIITFVQQWKSNIHTIEDIFRRSIDVELRLNNVQSF